MRRGQLSEYFDGVAAKRLTMVEADFSRSHQHEFQAVRAMVNFIGELSDPTPIPARFLYLTDSDSDPILEDASLTLYDARRKKPNRSAEYRFYFADNSVTAKMVAGDLLVIAKLRTGGLLVVVAQNKSSVAAQIEWLFGLGDVPLTGLDAHQESSIPGFAVRDRAAISEREVDVASSLILETIGIEVELSDDTFLDRILATFGGTWPDTKSFSPFARSLTQGADARDDPDAALLAWVDSEYVLYRTLEKHLIADRLGLGFDGSSGVEEFLRFSLSVQNRRKSRSGSSLENHIEEVLRVNGVDYVRGAKTEATSKPDFLFPGILEYNDLGYSPSRLHMLASKRSVKDRWRQILAEADRIGVKHLLTLEAAISEAQTDEMTRQRVQLVLPSALHDSFSVSQRTKLFSVRDFIEVISEA
jgi:hypothetical protein